MGDGIRVQDAAQDLVQRVPADNPFFKAFMKCEVPQHTLCGRFCDFEIAPRLCISDDPLKAPVHSASFGVFCQNCNRSLMIGEVSFIPMIDGRKTT